MSHQNHIIPRVKSDACGVLRSKTDRFWVDPQIRKHKQLDRMLTFEMLQSARLEIAQVDIPESPLFEKLTKNF